jgi:hypothetical protein
MNHNQSEGKILAGNIVRKFDEKMLRKYFDLLLEKGRRK